MVRAQNWIDLWPTQMLHGKGLRFAKGKAKPKWLSQSLARSAWGF